jgi:hypothetical protein
MPIVVSIGIGGGWKAILQKDPGSSITSFHE